MTTGLRIEIEFAEDAGTAVLDIATLADRAVAAGMEHAGMALHPEAELSILIAGDATLQKLNAQWRGRNKPTNVLSFPGDPDGVLIGDIAISLKTASREAGLENKKLDDHLMHLMVHGFLHLFGYDHENQDEAQRMERLETKILYTLGIADPYDCGNI